MPITISICDDEPEQIRYLRRLLAKWSAGKPFALEILEYESAEGFLFDYQDNPCDLLLLDIEMQGTNGMELARKLRAAQDELPIVFITGLPEYMSEGYDVEALHYLLKPIDEKRLFHVIDRYVEKREKKPEEILVTSEERTLHVSADQMMYVEAFGRKTVICLADGTKLPCEMGIGAFAGQKLTGMIQCHRSYLVNLRYIKGIGRTDITLDNDRTVPMSRRLFHEVNRAFVEYYTGKGQD